MSLYWKRNRGKTELNEHRCRNKKGEEPLEVGELAKLYAFRNPLQHDVTVEYYALGTLYSVM